ncbi:hypothetical protein QR685DRAFT_83515 [Neurospora intermedia]|uniref:Uncharacterized protein n=1 Tax=Neurospora intermedia TaxID=5142 RepID=A0ABR3D3R8_NEUIN
METSWCEHAAIRNIEPMAWNPSHSAQLVTSQTPDKGEVNSNRTNLSQLVICYIMALTVGGVEAMCVGCMPACEAQAPLAKPKSSRQEHGEFGCSGNNQFICASILRATVIARSPLSFTFSSSGLTQTFQLKHHIVYQGTGVEYNQEDISSIIQFSRTASILGQTITISDLLVAHVSIGPSCEVIYANQTIRGFPTCDIVQMQLMCSSHV